MNICGIFFSVQLQTLNSRTTNCTCVDTDNKCSIRASVNAQLRQTLTLFFNVHLLVEHSEKFNFRIDFSTFTHRSISSPNFIDNLKKKAQAIAQLKKNIKPIMLAGVNGPDWHMRWSIKKDKENDAKTMQIENKVGKDFHWNFMSLGSSELHPEIEKRPKIFEMKITENKTSIRKSKSFLVLPDFNAQKKLSSYSERSEEKSFPVGFPCLSFSGGMLSTTGVWNNSKYEHAAVAASMLAWLMPITIILFPCRNI